MSFRLLWGNPFNKKGGMTVSDLEFLSKVPIFDSLDTPDKNGLELSAILSGGLL